MKAVATIAALGLLFALVALVVGPRSASTQPSPASVVEDLGDIDRLIADQTGLEQARVSVRPFTPTQTDPDVIRLHEGYQAELDRMVARRSP